MNTNEKNRQYILDLFKVVSTTSILIVDANGDLKRLYCSFKIVAKVDVPPHIVVGEFYWADAVKMTLDLQEVYIIGGKGYYIWYFTIL